MADSRQRHGLNGAPMLSRGKKRASSSSQTVSKPFLQPTQHPPPPITNPGAAFQIPPLPPQATLHSQTQPGQTPKIAIPRLRRDSDAGSGLGTSKGGDKHRVSHACEPCRHRKTKCSGERPICKHCEDFKITCIYADGKRDRVKKEFGNMAGKLEEYERLLRDLSIRVDGPDQLLISKTLEKEPTPEEDDLRSAVPSIASTYVQPAEVGAEPAGETQVSAGVGSTGSLDRVNEDFNRSEATRATGFIGKNSEISWLQSLKKQTEYVPSGCNGDENHAQHSAVDLSSTTSYAERAATWAGANSSQAVPNSHDVALSESTYHCDDLTVLIPGQVDLYELPPKRTADAFFRNYLETVHPAFPIIGKITFAAQYHTFFETDNTPGNNWLAILNLIFAIGAKYSHLVQAEWRGDERDHLLYFTRARMLAMNSDTILGHPDLQQVQVAGLMAFYLLSINQINRAWNLSGIAIRYGVTLGLNLRNENKKMQDTSKEIRYRVWWSLCFTERALGVMTGRPSSINDNDCTVPLPVPIEEEVLFSGAGGKLYGDSFQSARRFSSRNSRSPDNSISTPSSHSSGMKSTPPSSTSPPSQHSGFDCFKPAAPNNALYFVHYTQLSNLTHEILRHVYSPGTMSESWARIEYLIGISDAKLESWRSNLPGLFDFGKKQRDQQFARQRMSLGFFYHSAKILINRPCLCRLDRKIPNESSKSKDFNRATAKRCVHAAKAMLNLLPDEPNPIGLYKIAPWWCLLHYLMQAATVLMLELAIRADHMPFEAEEIVNCAKKVVRWLKKMSEENLAAQRAWTICHEMLQRVAAKVGRGVHDLPSNINSSQAVINGERSMKSPPLCVPRQAPNGNLLYENQQSLKPFPDQGTFGAGQAEHVSLFHPSIYTFHDEFTPYDQSTTSLHESDVSFMFPSSGQMDFMGEGAYDANNLFFGWSQQWTQGNAIG
ncbi:MAG: hypothetical protein M1830_009215 [Pleopsidium flavum]|nr:MAG: hypothetical protein M1830_009215 [Pleopsidium flavum]